MPEARPNVLCFVTEQQRADQLGCLGNPLLHTPGINRLAGAGVRFTRGYCNNPLCMPGRATLFTGQTPRGHGVRTNGIPLSPALPTIGGALGSAGYRTHAVGKLYMTCFWPPHSLTCACTRRSSGRAWAGAGSRTCPQLVTFLARILRRSVRFRARMRLGTAAHADGLPWRIL